MKSYEDFFFDLAEDEKPIVHLLREIILERIPDIREKISYGVPYYFRKTRICFIWPASVKAGPKSGVMMGFCKGNLLSNEQGMLESNGRKEVYTMGFHSVKEINPALIKEILYETVIVDKQNTKL